MSDIPNVSDQSGPSRQSDLDTVKTAAIGRHRLETALVHGRAQSWVDRQRLWPYAVAGLLTTGLIASGIGIAGAYEDQKNVDGRHDVTPPAPIETTEPTAAPASPSSPPPTTPSTKPSTPAKPTTKTPPRKSVTQQQKTTTSPTKQGHGPSKVDQKPTTKPRQPTHDKGGGKTTNSKPTTRSAASKPHEAKPGKPKHRADRGRQHAKPKHHTARPRHLADPTYHMGLPQGSGSVGQQIVGKSGTTHHRKGRHAAH